jgi:hypothetical protein
MIRFVNSKVPSFLNTLGDTVSIKAGSLDSMIRSQTPLLWSYYITLTAFFLLAWHYLSPKNLFVVRVFIS